MTYVDDDQELADALRVAAQRAPAYHPFDRDAVLADAARLRSRRRSAGVAAAAAAAVLVGLGAVAALVPSYGGGDSDGSSGNAASAGAPETPAPHAGPEDPRLSRAVGEVGRGPFSDVFTNTARDGVRGPVVVYLTDLSRREEFLAAVREKGVTVETSQVLFRQGAHTRTDCAAELERVRVHLADRREGLPFHVSSSSATVDCAALEIGVSDVAAAQAYFDDPGTGVKAPGYSVRAIPGGPVQAY